MMRTIARHGMEGGAWRRKEASNARIRVAGAGPIAAALGIAALRKNGYGVKTLQEYH